MLSAGEAIMGYESTVLKMRLVIRALLTEVAHSFSDIDMQTAIEETIGAGDWFTAQTNRTRLPRRLVERGDISTANANDCDTSILIRAPHRL